MRRLLLVMLVVRCAVSAGDAEPTGLACIEHLDVPKYIPLARMAGLDGVVRLHVTGAEPKWTVLEAKPKLFESAGRQVGTTIRLKSACHQRSVELIFEFRIRPNEPTRDRDERVTFSAPNRIIISTNLGPINYH